MEMEEKIIFDKKKTNMVKCIAIIFMLMHHLFGCSVEQWMHYGGKTKMISMDWFVSLCMQMKVCVGMFVFLTAFGIARSYKNSGKQMNRTFLAHDSVRRYLSLEFDFIVVFVLAFFTAFLRSGGLRSIYGDNWIKGGGYVVIDLLGLSHYFGLSSQNETWWYITFAFFLIFFVPVLILLYQYVGFNLVVIAIFIKYLGINNDYLFCMVCGIWCAQENVLEKINDIGFRSLSGKANAMIKIFIEAILIEMCYNLRPLGFNYYVDALFPIIVAELCMDISLCFPLIETIMGVVGKHSGNIFLTHTIIFEYYFPSFIYGRKHWIVVLLILLSICLLLSVGIEYLKTLFKRIIFGVLNPKGVFFRKVDYKNEKDRSKCRSIPRR